MEWTAPFVVYRLNAQGQLEEVYHAQDLKQAKYWLTYIGLPGDVLCKTPLHPKHSKASNKAEYWSHKSNAGTPSSVENEWRDFAKRRNFSSDFPEGQLSAAVA